MRTVLFIFLLAVSTSYGFAQSGTASTSGQVEQTQIESTLAAKLQAIFSEEKQHLFLVFHTKGTATAVTVSDVKVTQWKGGTDTEQPNDVVQFAVHYTIYWSSFLHHGNGFTEARSVYSVTSGKLVCVGNQVINTNGKFLKGEVPSGLSGIMGKYLLHALL
jgi:hypothetical protein